MIKGKIIGSASGIYLYVGGERERERLGLDMWARQELLGHIGTMEWISGFGPIVDAFYDNDPRDYPGAAHFEVTEEMGAWLFNHPEATAKTFKEELSRFVQAWIESGETNGPRGMGKA
jgi:hypothetical protein